MNLDLHSAMPRTKLYTVLLSLCLAGYLWLGWSYVENEEGASTPGVCLFKSVTHLPCPSCGTTRAVALLIKGNIGGSVLINPLGIAMALALVVIPLWILADILLKRDSLCRWYVWGEGLLIQNRWVSVPAILLVIANWVWSIAKGL